MDYLTCTNKHKQAQVTICASTNKHTPLLKGVRLCTCVKKRMSALLVKAFKLLAPGYFRASEKREFESFLRSQGWTKKEALIAVANKYSQKGKR